MDIKNALGELREKTSDPTTKEILKAAENEIGILRERARHLRGLLAEIRLELNEVRRERDRNVKRARRNL